MINNLLKNDPDVKEILPLDADNPSLLFKVLDDGILLCKLINKLKPGTIDERSINIKKPLPEAKAVENLNLAI